MMYYVVCDIAQCITTVSIASCYSQSVLCGAGFWLLMVANAAMKSVEDDLCIRPSAEIYRSASTAHSLSLAMQADVYRRP